MTTSETKGPWYHGTPTKLTLLRKGSWVTTFENLARAFSHKPSLISLGGDCVNVKHNGQVRGFLYVVSEHVGPDDVVYLRDTAQTHWQTRRDLRVELVAELPPDDPPQLSEAEVAEMRKDIPADTTGFVGQRDPD